MKVAYIQNSYIAALVTDKICTVVGRDFGEDAGRKDIVVLALYALKSSGYAFRNHLEECIYNLVFLPCPADLYICRKPMVRPDDGFNYYAYF